MASRRNLKKAIHIDVKDMLFSLLFLHAEASEERKPALEELISKVIDSANDFIARISHTDGKGERKLVRNYYNKLHEEYLHFANEIDGEIDKLADEILTPEA